MAKKENVKKTDTTKKDSKNKRHFWKDFKAELKRVVWPTPKQLVNSTVAVITIVLILAFIVFVLDITFEACNHYGINKLQTVLQKNETNETSEDSTISDETTDASSETSEENSAE